MGYLIGLVVIVLTLVIGISFNRGPEDLLLFWDLPSFIIVVIPSMAFSIGGSSIRSFTQTWLLVFNRTNATKDGIRDACSLLNTYGKLSVLMGIVAFFIGIIILLGDLPGPNVIGPNMAVAVIPVLYGLLFKFLCYAAERRIIKRFLENNRGT